MSGYLSPAAVAARWQVSVRTVRRLIAAGALPSVRLSERTVRVSIEAVVAHEHRSAVAS